MCFDKCTSALHKEEFNDFNFNHKYAKNLQFITSDDRIWICLPFKLQDSTGPDQQNPKSRRAERISIEKTFFKVVGNEKVGGSGMCQTVPIWLGPRRSRFVSLSILPSSLILSIFVSAPVKQIGNVLPNKAKRGKEGSRNLLKN